MEYNTLFGLIGIVSQIYSFIFLVLLTKHKYGLSKSLLFAGVIVTFGFSLIALLLLFLGLSWHISNLLILGVSLSPLISKQVRHTIKNAGTSLISQLTKFENIIFLGIFVSAISFHFVIAVIKPEVSIDGQLYHGPILAELISSNSIWGWQPLNQYVFYTDLTSVGGINLATFTGNTYFDDALQIPYFALLILSINFVLSSRFTSPTFRIGISLLISAAPVIWLQPRILYVDLAYSVGILIAVFVITRKNKFDNYDLLIGAISIAAVIATKPSGLTAGFLLFVVLFFRYQFSEASESFKKRLFIFLCISIPIIASGFLFYIRNFFSFGNPIFPVKVSNTFFNLPGLIDFSVFASGERGTGVADVGRVADYFGSLMVGVTNGVQKLDYDPRSGGFGYVPLVVILIIFIYLLIQVLVALVKSRKLSFPVTMTSVYMVGILILLTTIQPSSFDSRYVIAPTVLLLCSLALIDFGVQITTTQRFLAFFAVLLAFAQIYWTEKNMFPGLKSILEITTLSSEWQPITPGNVWGSSLKMNWLSSQNESCSSIAVEYSGGLTASGMNEPSYLGVFSYGLYGKSLCNKLTSVQLEDEHTEDLSNTLDKVNKSDFLILYSAHFDKWQRQIKDFGSCWINVQELAGTNEYPERLTVMKRIC